MIKWAKSYLKLENIDKSNSKMKQILAEHFNRKIYFKIDDLVTKHVTGYRNVKLIIHLILTNICSTMCDPVTKFNICPLQWNTLTVVNAMNCEITIHCNELWDVSILIKSLQPSTLQC